MDLTPVIKMEKADLFKILVYDIYSNIGDKLYLVYKYKIKNNIILHESFRRLPLKIDLMIY